MLAARPLPQTLGELRTNARFIRVTEAGVREGMPHDVDALS